MSEEVVLYRGDHEIQATLYGKSAQGVVLCPPHPEYGGSRDDLRLVTIAEELAKSDISALCFDYSVYTGGVEEVKDAVYVPEYLGKSLNSLALVGYSYGSVVASMAAARFPALKGLVLIAPLLKIEQLEYDPSPQCPKLIVYGTYDDFVVHGINELYTKTQGEKQKLSLETDHFYGGYEDPLTKATCDFLKKVMG
jgi:uncharacterized protein